MNIKFEIISKWNNEIRIEGCTTYESLDDDEPNLSFYDSQGLEHGHYVPNNPYEEGSEEWFYYELIDAAFQSDGLFIQYLADYAFENKIVDRGDYLLQINDGAQFELKVEDYNSIYYDYRLCFNPKFNGEDIYLDENIFFEDPYQDDIRVKDMLYDYGYILEVPKTYWEEDDDKAEILSYYKDSFIEAYMKTISQRLGVYSKYGENAEQLFEQCDLKDVTLVNDNNLEKFLKNEGIIE